MSTPAVVRTVEEFRAALGERVQNNPAARPTVGFVPTMGALHSGHSALLDAARTHSDVVAASVFVNPLQFDDDADYQHYPRDLDADLRILAEHGADVVFTPELEEMYPGYPDAPQLSVTAGEMGRLWEGAARAGHFDGVATVVTKLFSILAPVGAGIEAWFGQKDAEQLAIISRLVEDLNLPVTIRALPIVRDENGLALSSRNQRLSESEYTSALQLSRTLKTLAERAAQQRPLQLAQLRRELDAFPGIDLDYLVAVDPASLRETSPGGELLSPEETLRGEALALVAARVGPVRLIDNMPLRPST